MTANKGQRGIDMAHPMTKDGGAALWEWFGLSYASWLTLPRVLMHAMPDDWQHRMAQLLKEYDVAFPNQPHIGTRVQIIRDGRLIKTPDWLLNYRHPDAGIVNELRGLAERQKEREGK